MKHSCIVLLFLATSAVGQVDIDVPLEFTGGDGERGFINIAPPVIESGALLVEGSLLGQANWATAAVATNVITLSPTPSVTAYRDGLLLRFVVPSTIEGVLTMGCAGLEAYPLLRPDGLPPARGQLLSGTVCEVIFVTDHWILMNAPESGCPPATLPISDRVCIETAPTGNIFFFAASGRCASQGGRLCRWDEYYQACTQLGTQLQSLFTAWEWIDDTQNHANTVVQVGRNTCTDQRWADPQLITPGKSRCCFPIR